ncbi:MAG: DNA-binding protein [Geobacteraceae bacterium]|nr:DNA-binding protein [Geobacteraceae bacterium]
MNTRIALATIILSLATATFSYAMPDMKQPADTVSVKAEPITGKAVEVINSGGYTYLLIENSDGFKDWVAIPETIISVGEEVELAAGYSMGDWKSKTLDRTFKNITFSGGPTDKYTERRKTNAHKGVNMSEPAPGNKKSEGKIIEGLKVEKAIGINAYDLTELFAKREELQNKVILVRGQVVKITTGVMNKNWVHIKDGTNNDINKLVITTQESPNNGDIVTFSGVLHNNVDFGGGYQYGVIMEDAVVKK